MSREFLTYEQAVAMLPDGDTIHTFLNPGAVLIGADWDREQVLDLLKTGKPELAGEMATRMDHGLAVVRENGPVWIQTKKDAR
jgi:hypothetical protein